MPTLVDTPIDLEEAGRISLEEARDMTLDQVTGEAYVNKNGFTNKRPQPVDRSIFNASSSAVIRA